MTDVQTPPEVEAPQTVAQAAELLERSERMLRHAQESRKVRKMAAADAKAIWKRELRKARLIHQKITPADVRDAMAHGHELAAEVMVEAAEIAERVGLPGTGWTTVDDLEHLYDLAAGMAASAREAAEQWSEWADAWQTICVWARQDADREMPPPPKMRRAS